MTDYLVGIKVEIQIYCNFRKQKTLSPNKILLPEETTRIYV